MRVFFFSCSCQSAVFFEALGEPWPEHECAGKRYDDLRKAKLSAGDAEFQVLIEQRNRGRVVPGHIAESMRRDAKMEDSLRASPKKTFYQEVLPEERQDFAGGVMAIERNIKMPRQFGLSSNPLTPQLLGRLGRGRWHRIRVRQDTEEGQRIVPEVSAFMEAREIAALGIREGHRVLVSVEPYSLPGLETVWMVTEATIR
ncbi:MAG: hypothetical protein OXK77_15935 [Gemmatimonadota bacterium]|nr:hypothetical protein [Gemmatimonadota bacterium]MDE2863517.1 hypothetical protein [Gemmatimonadota bacterium]